jgi:hypothetical protein
VVLRNVENIVSSSTVGGLCRRRRLVRGILPETVSVCQTGR